MKKLIAIITVLITIFSLSSSVFAEAPFNDVPVGTRNFTAISALKDLGLVDGYDDGCFRPYTKINRAEALKIITLATGIFDEKELAEMEIPPGKVMEDVPSSAWYAKYVKAALDKGIINGYEDGTFRPNDSIGLLEALKIYLESVGNLEYPELNEDSVFADTSHEDWYSEYIAFAKMNTLLYVNNDDEINPEQLIDRSYLAEIIYRMEGINKGNQFGKASYYGDGFNGRGTANGEVFDNTALTAAHRTLAFDTMVKVTNLANGESIEVRINDRGPYGPGRVIDLSAAAFEEIGALSAGIIYVKVETL
jgi:rare lipoprotein A